MRLKSARGGDTEKDDAIDQAVGLLAGTSEDVRSLIFELSPPILYDLGLEAALSWLADDLGRRSGITIRISADPSPKPLDDAAAGVIFRAVRELLTNVIKHARVPTADVSLRRTGDRLEIQIEDRGVGFDPQALSLESDRTRFGLFSVREQLRRIGGTLDIDSAERLGTRVTLTLPLDEKGSEPAPSEVAPAGAVSMDLDQ
jgi:signal transduction histidine kinase